MIFRIRIISELMQCFGESIQNFTVQIIYKCKSICIHHYLKIFKNLKTSDTIIIPVHKNTIFYKILNLLGIVFSQILWKFTNWDVRANLHNSPSPSFSRTSNLSPNTIPVDYHRGIHFSHSSEYQQGIPHLFLRSYFLVQLIGTEKDAWFKRASEFLPQGLDFVPRQGSLPDVGAVRLKPQKYELPYFLLS